MTGYFVFGDGAYLVGGPVVIGFVFVLPNALNMQTE
jgi:hypothetical protein